MPPRYIVLDKPRGLTPLECVSAWRGEAGITADVPTSYAGRLDPMAEGKLLVLIGEECKRQKEYTKLDKEYVIEVVLDIGTDTGDVLGIPELGKAIAAPTTTLVQSALGAERGTHTRAYPVFSSKTVNGKPLFLYALDQKLDTIEIPTHPETIYSLSLIAVDQVSTSELSQRVEDSLSLTPTSDKPSKALGADFRIQTIRPAWKNILSDDRAYYVLRIRVTCGSGSYMRTLAERIGHSLGTPAFALSIHRTRIGRYVQLPFGLGFWSREYR